MKNPEDIHAEILNDLEDSLVKHGKPYESKEGNFDKDKWYWNDTKRINEQEKRITQLIAESSEHKKAIISLSKKVETLLGQSRWDLGKFAKKSLDKLEDCQTVHVPSCPHYWVKEEFHED